jgi:hypothetical protein
VFEWLATPDGSEFSHAVIVLLLAIAAYFSYRAHTNTRNGGKK